MTGSVLERPELQRALGDARLHRFEYLVSGLVRCSRCGNPYLGTVAHGRRGAYRCYTCFSRNHYGRHGCQADRLPAEALERAVLESIHATYADTDLIERPLAGARQRADAAVPSAHAELRSVEAMIGKAEQALERSFTAFESGTLTGRRFAGRIEELETRLAELRKRREEIQDELERETVREPS